MFKLTYRGRHLAKLNDNYDVLRFWYQMQRDFGWRNQQVKTSSFETTHEQQNGSPSVDEKFQKLFDFTRENFPYRCGNTSQLKSNFWFLRRRRLEKQLMFGQDKIPPFLFLYRGFVDAFKNQDFKSIKAMCEPKFYDKLRNAVMGIEKLDGKFQ